MNFEFAEQINSDLEQLDFVKALQTSETELKKLPETEFHEIIGKSLTNQADDLASWVEDFFIKASNKVGIKALYFEMNEFTSTQNSGILTALLTVMTEGLTLMIWNGFQTLTQTVRQRQKPYL